MKLTFTILITSAILLFSCKKDSTEEITSPNTVSDNNILISKMVQLDTTKVAPLDTINVWYFAYDNINRLSSLKLIGYPINNNQSSYSNDAVLFYNSNDTIPNRVVTQFQEGFGSYRATLTSFINYSPTLRYDSLIQIPLLATNISSTTVRKTVINNNIETIYNTRYSNNFINRDTIVSTITKQNGNNVLESNTGPNPLQPNNIAKFACTYDNKNKPFNNKIGFLFNDSKEYNFYQVDPFQYGKNNNVTEINNTLISSNAPAGTVPSRVNFKYFYTYNGNNYPIEVRIQKVSVVGTTFIENTNKIKYFY
jgi:hypothetical protein